MNPESVTQKNDVGSDVWSEWLLHQRDPAIRTLLGKRRRRMLVQRRLYPESPIHAFTLIRPPLPS
jgi:hypothetical protein